jgi:hypothetical protein
MKRLLDATFRYTPSFDTDVRRTFERIRRQQRARTEPKEPGASQPCVHVVAMEPLQKSAKL